MPKKLILIVEDNEDTRFVFSAILNYDGYRIVEACNGALGFERALEHHPDLVITDIDMPVMDGFAAARRMRGDERTCAIPILVITGNDFTLAEQAEADSLFDGCFSKPMQPSRVLAEVQRMIGPPGG
ncbi:response regulator [Longimicrobium sp.]|uniref:response regulator n=1 Tax=Longimicrobium sp. TaxID=2029185 RepID=UPI002CD57BA0|nr:response regulator [Longimicrobium sp.]HSU17023.1 response regulator [Longimicrobium sp.]